MKIYRLGLDKIPRNVDDRKVHSHAPAPCYVHCANGIIQLLKVHHTRLVNKKRSDPLRALPLELTEMMLKYLDFTEVV
jgi:predicted outer membrane lipoprotein